MSMWATRGFRYHQVRSGYGFGMIKKQLVTSVMPWLMRRLVNVTEHLPNVIPGQEVSCDQKSVFVYCLYITAYTLFLTKLCVACVDFFLSSLIYASIRNYWY